MSVVTESTSQVIAARGHNRRVLTNRQREERWGFFFISPWLIGFALFTLFPMIASLIFTTYDFTLSVPDEAKFIGLDNWRRMLFEDETVWRSLWITIRYAFLSLPIGMIVAFLLAVLLNSKHLMGRAVFRTLFYAPTMIPGIASILIFVQVFNPYTGWVNRIIEVFGIKAMGVTGLRWFDDPNLIYLAFVFIGLYGIGNTIVINLAGLQGVPTELYEAATIDGASWFTSLYRITLPMVSPVIFYNLVLGTIGSLQYFTVPFVINGGSGYPDGTTEFFMIHFFKQTFRFSNMGYGATLAWLIFVIALVATLALFGTSRRWVYYAGESNR